MAKFDPAWEGNPSDRPGYPPWRVTYHVNVILDKAFAKYRGAYHIGSKSKTSEARKRKEQRKKIKEQEIERFK